MKQPAKLWKVVGTPDPSKKFLLEYQKAVLFTLYRDEVLDQSQYEGCVRRLER